LNHPISAISRKVKAVGLNLERALRIDWSKPYDGKRRRLYVFKCSNCEKELKIPRRKLKGSIGLCFDCYKIGPRPGISLRPYESLYHRFLAKAKRDGHETDIDYEFFLRLTKIETCCYCGEFINWAKSLKGKNRSNAYNLDRSDNNLGYLKSNVVVCCKRCNYVKSDRFTYDQYVQIGALMKTFDHVPEPILQRNRGMELDWKIPLDKITEGGILDVECESGACPIK
jgi:hypothetical protein